MDFFDQYKHPNWQKKRLEVLEAAGFVCQRCFGSESQIHVHHKRYVKNRKVWEYEASELEALCGDCHKQTHADKEVFQSIQARLASDCLPELYGILLGYLSNVNGRSGVGFDGLQEIPEQLYYEWLIGKLAAVSSNHLSINVLEDLIIAVESLAPGEKKEFTLSRRRPFADKGPW